MGRKKRKVVEEKPDIWCYFCDREFSTEMDLVDHQNQRHFKCLRCNRRAANVYGLCTHSLQVHKTSLVYVPNALDGRNDVNVGRNLIGMNGIPVSALEERRKKLGIKSPTDSVAGGVGNAPGPAQLQYNRASQYAAYGQVPGGYNPYGAMNPYGMYNTVRPPPMAAYNGAHARPMGYGYAPPPMSYGAPPPGRMPPALGPPPSMNSIYPPPKNAFPPPGIAAAAPPPAIAIAGAPHVAAINNSDSVADGAGPNLPAFKPPPGLFSAPPPATAVPVSKPPAGGMGQVVPGPLPTAAPSIAVGKKTVVPENATPPPAISISNSKKSSNVTIVFQSPNGLSMEELRAIKWRKRRNKEASPAQEPNDK